jgi:ribosomal protein L15
MLSPLPVASGSGHVAQVGQVGQGSGVGQTAGGGQVGQDAGGGQMTRGGISSPTHLIMQVVGFTDLAHSRSHLSGSLYPKAERLTRMA